MNLILYSKPGCHLCEGLAEKLAQISDPPLQVEIRDITTQDDWRRAYEYEIPVLCYQDAQGTEQALPRLSPRAPLSQLQTMLQTVAAQGEA